MNFSEQLVSTTDKSSGEFFKKSRWALLFFVLSFLPFNVGLKAQDQAPTKAEVPQCLSSREYIAIVEFFRVHEDYGIEETRGQEIADSVSKGCTGAAQRFIHAFRLAHRLELGGARALALGLELAQVSDEVSAAFMKIFSRSFTRNDLDLPATASVDFARKLSYEFKGDLNAVMVDFDQLVEFCKGDELALPRPTCADFVVDLLAKGQGLNQQLAPAFLEAFKYLRAKPEIQMNIGGAMDLAKELVLVGPQAIENFKQAFEYGISPKGLDRSPKDALLLARQMGLRTQPRTQPKGP